MAKRIFTKEHNTDELKLQALLSNTEERDGCMLWTRALNTDGYPHMFNNVKVHRLVYKLNTKENIDEKVIRHTCDNPRCINPSHLISGTALDNVKDRDERGRTHKVITKDIVKKVKDLLSTHLLKHSEIAILIGIDPRRVSDINCGRYGDEGNFIRRRKVG